MNLATLTFNPYSENSYVVSDPATQECTIVDPGCLSDREKERLAAFIGERGLKPVVVIATHGHIDHICGINFVKDRWGIPLAASSKDQPILDSATVYAATMGFSLGDEGAGGVPKIDIDLDATSEVKIGEGTLHILKTPGHTPGGVALYAPEEGFLLSGDTLFRESIGRTDLPGGHYPSLMQSLIETLMPLDGTTRVFPGHGPDTTIAHERTRNPFITEALQGEAKYHM